ncbi:hypothetical protein EG834_17320, partial [bacterium]|nr:hypothetical protein [bacterium]
MASDDAVLLAFDCLLKKTGARQVRVLLSSSLVDHVAIPGLVHWLKNSDLVALGRSRLAAFYGTDQVQRKVIVSREGYGAACLAASAGKELLDCLEQTADARQVDIVGIQPLAARAIEVLRKELCGNSALAIVIDEVDALWVGLRANGSWRSIRNLPASALRYSSPLDLLKRECLSAGLSGVEYIYCAASGSADAPVLDWGQDSTDFSDRLRLGGGARRLDLSFREKRGSRMGWYLLGASIIALMGSAYAWRNLQLQLGAAVLVME